MKQYLAQTEPLPVHPTKVHPMTGEPLRALGFTKRGAVIWPQMGGSHPLGTPPVPQQTGNTPGIPTLGGGFVQPGGPQPGQPPVHPVQQVPQGQPAGQPAGQPQGQPAGQPQGQPQVQPGQFPAGQPQVQPGQQQGQPGGQPQGQPGQLPAPVPGPPPGDRGFPEGVPVENMSVDQRANFYRYHMRRNQDEIRRLESQYGDYAQVVQERDQLRQATQTDLQRAQAEAEARGRQIGMESAAGQIVEAYFRAAAANRLSEEAINAQLTTMNRAAFVQNGAVSQQQIYDYVNVIVGGQPQPQQLPAGYGQQYAAPGGQPQPVYAQATVGQPVYPGQPQLPVGYGQPQLPAGYGQPMAGYGQPQPGYGQQPGQQMAPNAAAFGDPGQQQSFGQPVQQAPGGWPQYAPVPQQPQQQVPGWNVPGMPGYGQGGQFRQVPNYGQGPQPTSPQSSPEAGKQRAADRHGTTRTAQRTGQGQQTVRR
jgi:hypothetical protein